MLPTTIDSTGKQFVTPYLSFASGLDVFDDTGNNVTVTFNVTAVSGFAGLAPGICTVTAFAAGYPFNFASTPGGANYAPGAPVTRSVTVTP